MFQSTHSLRSATKDGETLTWAVYVSIHALLAECDNNLTGYENLLKCFNPRTPCGVRLQNGQSIPLNTEFQSTHSLRSATYYEGAKRFAYVVSIHALLAECDAYRR